VVFPVGELAQHHCKVAVLVAMAFTPALASQLYASLACLGIVAGAYVFVRRRQT
jgi:hypothetical protein